jgi:hypothetical protein
VAAGLLLTLAGLASVAAWAWRYEPAFYRAAIVVDDDEQREASDEMLSQAAALASAAQKQDQWSASFTDDQINGWLAVDLPENYPALLPAEISQPRIHLGLGRATIACRYNEGNTATVVSIELEAYMADPSTLALRICDMRAGAIPLPLGTILEGLSQVATSAEWPLRWTKAKGQPVALIPLSALGGDKAGFELESLELRDGAIYLAGRTASGRPTPRAAAPTASRQPDANSNVQR